ncbi:hypothetical protein [Neorhizobium sp. T25_13]|uniref:hypothetical protein n=1 Tax=Neorhizobium sp. T25_13 TaxID=2093830 RepID=UPI000CFA5D70|nr:hypothetical protein [Neorhizobium sp. T25_13]
MTKLTAMKAFQRKIDAYCAMRLMPIFSTKDTDALTAYMRRLIERRCGPQRTGSHTDWDVVARLTGVDAAMLAVHHRAIDPAFDATIRWSRDGDAGRDAATSPRKSAADKKKALLTEQPKARARTVAADNTRPRDDLPKRKPADIIEFPEPWFREWSDPSGFAEALQLHMRRHGETYWVLHRSVVRSDEAMDKNTLLSWIEGRRVPRSTDSFEVLGRIERRYRLPDGYFKAKLPHRSRSASGFNLSELDPAERRRIAWHLPDDFNALPFAKRQEILDWVRRVIISGSTDYRKFQAAAAKQRYSPVGEYRKITEEIIRLMPDEERYPRPAAEAVRSFLMLRLGLHLGLRQKNLRQLMLCPRGQMPRPERVLEKLKRGEIRWSERDGGWEVLIPAVAFKNAHSSFFGDKPFRLVLPDLLDLYRYIDDYVERHRATLLRGVADPGTFFVKTVKTTSTDAAYDVTTFYEAWRLTIQRYGIYNPYTGRGAIKGLLPHGPHNVRDVLATHILKQTGSYEQASYAIQDTADMVAKHYGRFLPQDKAALAARILNQVWEAA